MGVKHTITIPEWLDRMCAWPVMIYRRLKYGYTFRRISLGGGEYAIVDQEDYYRLCNFKWSAICSKGHVYAARIIRDTEFGRVKTMFMHREIMNAPKGMLVDHRNSVGLDNRRDNMRLATHSQNNCNMTKKANTTSKYLGVCFVKDRNQWYARLKHHGKGIYIGRYENEIDAAKAYDEAAKKYHGEFARLNFPEEN
jgi:hypothetical protein